MVDVNDRKEYVRRADDIESADLMDWTVEDSHFIHIQSRLFEKSAILLAGPRGSGKTHHMKVAYNKSLQNPNYPLSIYVSFGKYYHLEPLQYKSAVAYKVFHTWVLGKIILGCRQLVADLRNIDKKEYNNFDFLNEFTNLEVFISQIEKDPLSYSEYGELIQRLTIYEVVRIIDLLINKLDRRGMVLFLDDAALTLSHEYMREFFDIFRSLKTPRISPKASVYPGSTEYGPRFHIGQDAIIEDCWPCVEDKSYREFMDRFLEKRFPTLSPSIPNDIIELFKYISFGIPREFINLISDFEKNKDNKDKRNQEVFNTIIEDHAELIKAEYLSFSEKNPQYKTIISTGDDLFGKIIWTLVKENRQIREKSKVEKNITIGILQKQEYGQKTHRMIRFLVEAGLLYPLKAVKHGSNNVENSEHREYERYIPHFLFLIKSKAFSSSRGFNPGEIVEFIKRDSAKHPVRRTIDRLLEKSQIEKIRLDLPPCSHCGRDRLSEDQKFCHHCGHQLIEKSRFEECMKIPIERLPLPNWQKERLKQETSIKTIEDIISDSDPGSKFQKIKHIGPKRSEKLFKLVKIYIEEYLS